MRLTRRFYGGREVGDTDPQTDSRESTNGREMVTGKAALSVPFFPPPSRFPRSHVHFRVPFT